jgi:uncharacterized phage protein gp47/JayE
MAFERPTLIQIVDRIQGDLVSRLSLVTPILRRSVVYVLSRVMAGAAHLMHGHLEYLSRQIFPDLSDEEYLLRQGKLYEIARNQASYATGNVTLTGTTGSVVPVGTIISHSDGAEYETDTESTLAAGTATVAVTALVAGADGSRVVGTLLSLQSPIAGVDSVVTVASGGLSGGADQEDIEDYRLRVLARLQDPPQGGSAADYVAWAKEITGVTRAWCYPLEDGAGTVTVRFVRDDDASIIPDSGEVATVHAHLNTLKPATAALSVQAPVAVPLDMTIEVVPDTSVVRAAVEAEVEDLLRRVSSPGGTILLSELEIAVGTASGVTDFSVTSPSADVTHTTIQIATIGTITWV